MRPLPIDRIAELVDALQQGTRPPPEAALAFLDAWRYWRMGLPWEDAIGLSGGIAVRLRDENLLAAADLLDDGTAGPWTLAGRLADQVRTFECRHWPKIQAGAEPRGALQQVLTNARRANGRELPRTQQAYFGLLRQNRRRR